MSTRSRIVIAAVAAVILATVAVIYVLRAPGRDGAPTASPTMGNVLNPGPIDLHERGRMLFRSADPGTANGRLAAVPLTAPGGPRTIGRLSCVRVYVSGGTGVCLVVERSAIPKIYAVVLDADLRTVRRISLPGAPSRARVSPSGRLVAWTVFVSGHSYTSSNLSTRTGILDTRTGRLVADLEGFTLIKDGKRSKAPDRNYWGVTFAADDNRFYATVRTKGRTYLVVGSLAAKTMRTLRQNVECPSLSPDGTRLVFKKATGDPARPWRLHVLALPTMRETPLAERESVDDQAAWLDDRTVIYGRVTGEVPGVWAVPADGSGAPRMLVRNAFSPTVMS